MFGHMPNHFIYRGHYSDKAGIIVAPWLTTSMWQEYVLDLLFDNRRNILEHS